MHLHDTSAQSLSQSPPILGSRTRSISTSNYNQQHHYNNNHSQLYSPAVSGGIRKKPLTSSRDRSVSTSYAERLHHLALNQASVEADFTQQQQNNQDSSLNWLTPQHSPEPSCFFQDQVHLDQFQWVAPTPPRSDSGVATLSTEACDEASQPISSSPETFAFDQVTAVSDMSSLEFLLPQQYANPAYRADGDNTSYSMDSGYPARTQATTSSGLQYGQTVTSSPSFHQSGPQPARRQSDLSSHSQMYNGSSRRTTGSYDSPSHEYRPAQSHGGMPPISGMMTASPMTSPVPGPSTMAPGYASITRSPAIYDSQFYGPAYTSAPGTSHMYAPAPSAAYPTPYIGGSMDSARRSSDVRNAGQKERPKCWDHGCNGREFSTFSNMLRHQREKSGTATKSYCPKCNAEFTRTTARNGHLAHDKCSKGSRLSEER